MKKLLTLIAIAISTAAAAQETDLPKINGDTLISSSGFKIYKDQNVKIGVGTMQDGTFKYIRTNSASLFAVTSINQGLASSANALPRSRSGQSMKVIRTEARGNKRRGYNYYAVLGGAVRYEVDVENAIASGELVVPNEYKPKVAGAAVQLSAADELKKFKELLDSGAITQAEYDAKKKQILGL